MFIGLKMITHAMCMRVFIFSSLPSPPPFSLSTPTPYHIYEGQRKIINNLPDQRDKVKEMKWKQEAFHHHVMAAMIQEAQQ